METLYRKCEICKKFFDLSVKEHSCPIGDDGYYGGFVVIETPRMTEVVYRNYFTGNKDGGLDEK